jgi:hypothetical protein
MTVGDAKQRIYTLATGESEAPDTDVATTILTYINIMQDRWAREPGVEWNSLRELVDVGTVTATNSFSLDGIVKVSRQEGDYVTITKGNQVFEYSIVSPQRLKTTSSTDACAVFGSNLVFARAFTANDGEFGGTIAVPAYAPLTALSDDKEDILVDDPDWVCFMVAAELMAHDVTKSDQAQRMLAYATDAMVAMKENNEAQVDELYNDWNPMGHISEDY